MVRKVFCLHYANCFFSDYNLSVVKTGISACLPACDTLISLSQNNNSGAPSYGSLTGSMGLTLYSIFLTSTLTVLSYAGHCVQLLT